MAVFENKWTPGQIIQIGMIGFGLTGLYYTGVGRIEALEKTDERHAITLEKLDKELDRITDVNIRLIRIEEKVDALREARNK